MSDENEFFTTRQVAIKYNISDQTVRLWCREFAAYLSPSANPSSQKKRRLTHDDMSVIDLIFRERQRYRNFQEIQAVLASGQRGILPENLPEEIDRVRSVETEKRLALQIDALRNQVRLLSQENEQLKHVRDENIESRTRLEMIESRLEEMNDLAQENKSLYEQIGRLKGQVDVLREMLKRDN